MRRVLDGDSDTPVMQVDPVLNEEDSSRVGQRRVVLVPTGRRRHTRIDPRQGTSHFSPSVDGACKFGGSSGVGVGQFSTSAATTSERASNGVTR